MNQFDVFVVQKIEEKQKGSVYFFLKSLGFSEHYIKLLRNKENAILLNGKPVGMRARLQNGDTLSVLQNPKPSNEVLECDGTLDIVYEDENYLVVNKPHNLATIPTRSHINDNLGGQIVKYMRTKTADFTLRILNRLDKETAGLVVVAKNIQAYKNAMIDKTYYALCHGTFDRKSFTITKNILTITQNGINQIKRVISPNGKPAITHVDVQKQLKNMSLISLHLETGRTHQIRVHLASENHPLVGDQIYGQDKKFSHAFLILKDITIKNVLSQTSIALSIPFPKDWPI